MPYLSASERCVHDKALYKPTFTFTVNDSERTDEACYKRDVRRSQHPRLISDWLVANEGVTEIASLQIARFWGLSGSSASMMRGLRLCSWEFAVGGSACDDEVL